MDSPSLIRQQPGEMPALRDRISEVLLDYHVLAVVGLSPKPSRPSYGVAAYMKSRGYRVIPVNPNSQSVLNETCYPTLDEVPDRVEVVVIFRKPEHVPSVIESAIRKQVHVVWMQEGIEHPEAAERARKAGIEVIQDRCILKEHAKRFVTEGI